MSQFRVACAQINTRVGDFEGNTDQILDAMRWAEEVAADALLVPELALCGYPPEDLLLRESFIEANRTSLDKLAAASGETAVVIGFVDRAARDDHRDDSVSRNIANAAAVLGNGELAGVYHKVLLPNYGVFDEARYFAVGGHPGRLWSIAGSAVGVSICEDIWSPDGPPGAQAAAGAQILLNINGSPYHTGKARERARLISAAARRAGVPVVYLNMVGGQDELVFDGDSMIFDAEGGALYRSPQFALDHFVVDLPLPEASAGGEHATAVTKPIQRSRPGIAPPQIVPTMDEEEEVYTALVTGLRDYVAKNGFTKVVIGLSGGIDSALTAAIAVDALGPDAVWGITMPTRYSSEGSVSDSADLAERLGIRFDVIPIDAVFGQFLEALEIAFAGTESDVAEENLQARIRGAILMAVSNKFGGMVVATGNKSEMAVGYATLYGDMAGGFAVLKDVFKTLVYRLCEWRNREVEAIPRSIIEKPPSAELRPDQKDTDSLPDYEVLDAVLRRYIELDLSVSDIVNEGLSLEVVRSVALMVDRNEYKRRQAAPGVRITQKAFGRDRRLPITNAYRAP